MRLDLSNLPGRVVTLLLIIAAVVAAGLSSGSGGGESVSAAAGGWLSAQATLIAPAGPAFSIWTVIYLGLGAYGIWQLTQSQHSERHRRVKPWVLAGVLLNSLWLVSAVTFGQLLVSALVIIVLLVVLARVMMQLASSTPTNRVEAVLLDTVQGLYLGWVTIATVANVTALIASLSGAEQGETSVLAMVMSLVVLVVAGLIGLAMTRGLGTRLSPALSLSWGLAWIAIGRAGATPLVSWPVAVLAGVLAVVVIGYAAQRKIGALRGRRA